MKKLVLFFAAFLMILAVNAQTYTEEVDLLQAEFGMDKKSMVAEFVNPSDLQKDAFWKLYDEYETSRKELGKKRIDLLTFYANNHETMTNEIAKKWTDDVIKLSQSTDKLLVSYYKKVMKETDALTALKFYHIENYILTSIRIAILGEIPFISEH